MNHTKPFWFFIRWRVAAAVLLEVEGGGLYEMVIRADRPRERPEPSRG